VTIIDVIFIDSHLLK